ncbi:PIN domain-containing protein [soil metagenome]|nr:PIN domain-containing protein [Trueperaceae bacterium]
MSAVALDTSVVVAALLGAHEHHEAARRTVDDALSSPGGAILPVPVLFEAYAVLTRLPAPWRLRADVAERLLRDTFEEHATVVSLPDEDGAWSVVRNLAQRGLIGGIAHDAHIAACAQAAGADALATLNRRDFDRLDLGSMALVP